MQLSVNIFQKYQNLHNIQSAKQQLCTLALSRTTSFPKISRAYAIHLFKANSTTKLQNTGQLIYNFSNDNSAHCLMPPSSKSLDTVILICRVFLQLLRQYFFFWSERKSRCKFSGLWYEFG